jgi:hypothetical protein
MIRRDEDLPGIVTISDHIKELIGEAPAALQASILADVLASAILTLPHEAQTPLLTRFAWGVQALVEERNFPTVGNA